MPKMNAFSWNTNNSLQALPVTLYRAAQVRELDRIAIEDRGIPGFELMSRAGEAVFRRLREQWPDARSVTVFCGAGNNGGDGYIVARLALQEGMRVCVLSLAEPEKLQGDALTAYRNYSEASGKVDLFAIDQTIDADVIVDALLGTGLDRPVIGLYAAAIEAVNQSPAPVIAVDIPSGLHADTGNVMACAVKADCTVTFIGLKQGLFTGQAADYCGTVFHAALDVPDDVFQAVFSSVYLVTDKPWPRRSRCAHKGSYGHVLVVGGNRGFSGAARLAGEAALRVGAGLVSIATRSEHAGMMNLARPELMCHGVESTEQLTVLLEKADVVVIGPGLGQSYWAKELLMASISSQKKLVIDADGLNLLANLFLNNLSVSNPDWILTPHPGEAARLLGCSIADIQRDRFASVSRLQAKYGGIAVLKGAGTVIASATDIAVSTSGNPGMASGGMGDVLAGVIAGFLAQGLDLKNAAQQGVYSHGAAADWAAEEQGERGLLAGDLMPYLRKWVNR